MQAFSTLPREMVGSLWRHRRLALTLVRREVAGRYRGSFMGIIWSLLQPLMMLGVYTFVFGVVFQSRWGTGGGSKAGFALTLFSGLLVFNIFADCVTRAPSLIVVNTNFVKKVMFPLEILPWVTMGAALFHAAVNFLVWLAFYLVIVGPPHPTVLLLPIVVLPCVLFTMGLSWMLAALGVYLRDVTQIVGIVVTALMFLSPIFYPSASLPETYRRLIFLNPLTPAVEQVRDILMWGTLPSRLVFAAYLGIGMVVAWLGFAWFPKTRKGFADVL
jgi:lipopolysaccharide transport system permease protein